MHRALKLVSLNFPIITSHKVGLAALYKTWASADPLFAEVGKNKCLVAFAEKYLLSVLAIYSLPRWLKSIQGWGSWGRTQWRTSSPSSARPTTTYQGERPNIGQFYLHTSRNNLKGVVISPSQPSRFCGKANLWKPLHFFRISSMVENLCTEWGERLACFEGKEYFAFPAIERLAGHNHYETFLCADYFCYGGDGPLHYRLRPIESVH